MALAMRLNLKLKTRIKMVFFDRSVIKTRWNKFNKDPINRAGLLVRKIARNSIRRRIKKSSPPSMPGKPPFSRKDVAHPPFKMIYSVPYNLNTSVIVGMVGFGLKGEPVPGLQEHGGTVQRTLRFVYQRRTSRGRFTSPGVRRRTMMATYPERPFMRPALKIATIKLPELWKNSLKK